MFLHLLWNLIYVFAIWVLFGHTGRSIRGRVIIQTKISYPFFVQNAPILSGTKMNGFSTHVRLKPSLIFRRDFSRKQRSFLSSVLFSIMLALKMKTVNTLRMPGHVKIVIFFIAALNQKIHGTLSNHIGELIACIWLLLTTVSDAWIVRIVMDVLSVFSV